MARSTLMLLAAGGVLVVGSLAFGGANFPGGLPDPLWSGGFAAALDDTAWRSELEKDLANTRFECPPAEFDKLAAPAPAADAIDDAPPPAYPLPGLTGVPEPWSLALLSVGLIALLRRRRR